MVSVAIHGALAVVGRPVTGMAPKLESDVGDAETVVERRLEAVAAGLGVVEGHFAPQDDMDGQRRDVQGEVPQMEVVNGLHVCVGAARGRRWQPT